MSNRDAIKGDSLDYAIVDEIEPTPAPSRSGVAGRVVDSDGRAVEPTPPEPSDNVLVGGWADVIAQTDSARRRGLKSTREAAASTAHALEALAREGRTLTRSMSALRTAIREGAPLAVRADTSDLGASLFYSIRQSRGMSKSRQLAIVESARARGFTWDVIAEPLEISGDALRKRMAR